MSLKARLAAAPPILVAPGVVDGLTGALAEAAGAEAVYLTGAGIAYGRFGRPDLGLVTMSEVAETIAVLRDRIALPIIADADTGFGNALNVQRTVRAFERAGANALQIEDQTNPKRCGHLAGKSVVPLPEALARICAALDARGSEETLIIARTDALAVEGFGPALERAHAFAEAGADAIFLDALETEAQMAATVAAFHGRLPVMANMVEGGRSPARSAAELEAIGFALVIFPGGIVRAQAATAEAYYASLLAHGSNAPFSDRMLDFAGLNRALGTEAMLALGDRYGEGAE
ncbi:MAG: isocitrate lyase/phosphoenolpyruvate mutase family protein [Pseudomonadota bacterium]